MSFYPEVKHDHEVAALRSAWRVGSAQDRPPRAAPIGSVKGGWGRLPANSL